MNTSGRKLVAQRICEGAAPEPVKTTARQLLRYHHDDDYQGGAPLRIMSVCGPYTTSDNLDYQPLLDLVTVINTERPDVVLLAGPFVDLRHQAVLSGQTMLQFQDGGEVLVPYETFFANKIAAVLEDLYTDSDNLQTQFVIVPSLEDATAEFVYPQPPMKDRIPGGKTLGVQSDDAVEIGALGLNYIEMAGRESKGPRRVHCVPNPCTLKINELVIGITSTDVLFHISAEETNAHLELGSRLGRIAQHMLQQKSYYPLFPSGPMVNLNLKFMDQWSMPCRPDLLILPSRLSYFARTVLDGTVVVNPGYLTRETNGGTYAMMHVQPFPRESLENSGSEDVELDHRVNERICVEIKRI